MYRYLFCCILSGIRGSAYSIGGIRHSVGAVRTSEEEEDSEKEYESYHQRGDRAACIACYSV